MNYGRDKMDKSAYSRDKPTRNGDLPADRCLRGDLVVQSTVLGNTPARSDPAWVDYRYGVGCSCRLAVEAVRWDSDNNWCRSIRQDLFSEPFNWEKIKKQARKIILLHSDNDPYVPLDHAKFIAEKLTAELIVKEGQGHFNLEVGAQYAQFPTLLKLIEETEE